MKKITRLLSGVLACLSLQAAAAGQVDVMCATQPAPVTTLTQVENLSQLIANPAIDGQTWWPGTVIAERLATAAILQQQQQVIARLQAWSQSLRADNDLEQAAVVDNVSQQVRNLKVTGRQIVPLDPDIVRLHPETNRRLEGEYSLWLAQKPTTVTLFGVLRNSGATSWQPGKDTRDYLQSSARLAGAERNIAQVISPAGQVTDVPVAYWNHRYYEAPLGSLVFVGFSSWTLPSAYEDLNQQIVSLLTHRVPE